jgi:hypothetical protein
VTVPVDAWKVVAVGRWDSGPGRLTCDRCGRNFDPIAHAWACPFCGLSWPWAAAVRAEKTYLRIASQVERFAVRRRPVRSRSA